MQLHRDLNKKGVFIVALSDEADSKVAAHLKKEKTPYYVASGSKSATAYEIRGFPTFFVVDPKGKITYVGHSIKDAREAVEECLEKTPPKPSAEVAKDFEAEAAKKLKKADALYKKKDLRGALDVYEAVVDEYADTPSGKQAKAQAKKIKPELAESDASAALETADALAAGKKYSKAMEAYEKVVEDFGKTASGKKAATKLEQLRGDKTIAKDIREAEAAKKCNGWLQMARNLVKNDKPEAARKYYEKIIDQYGDTSFAVIAKDEMAGL